jgi:hypothetical protein
MKVFCTVHTTSTPFKQETGDMRWNEENDMTDEKYEVTQNACRKPTWQHKLWMRRGKGGCTKSRNYLRVLSRLHIVRSPHKSIIHTFNQRREEFWEERRPTEINYNNYNNINYAAMLNSRRKWLFARKIFLTRWQELMWCNQSQKPFHWNWLISLF